MIFGRDVEKKQPLLRKGTVVSKKDVSGYFLG